MKITGYPPIKNADAVKSKKSASSASANFLDFLNEAEASPTAAETPVVENAAPVSMLDAMLSLQEMPEEELRRKKMIQRGRMTLDTLEQVRHGLLTGQLPKHVLRTLATQINTQREAVSDPRLLEIMDEIELRAAVELAKLEMSST